MSGQLRQRSEGAAGAVSRGTPRWSADEAASDLVADACASLGASCERVTEGSRRDCDAALVDEGGDGLAKGATPRAKGYAGPLVLIAVPRPGLIARAQSAGFTGLCPKPLRRDALSASLEGHAEHSTAASHSVEALSLGGRVLVADDNRVNQRAVVAMLRKDAPTRSTSSRTVASPSKP